MFEHWVSFFCAMSQSTEYVSAEYSTRTYYVLSDTFNNPIEFKLHAKYNSERKAKEAFEIAFHPCKVVQFIQPKTGMAYMQSAEIFQENGSCV